MTTAASTPPMLDEIVSRLVARFDPLQIILFGSWARGEADAGTDVDLLLVLAHAPLEQKRDLMVEALRALNGLTIPVDVIVTDPADIKQRGAIPGTILRPALRDGRVIYERL